MFDFLPPFKPVESLLRYLSEYSFWQNILHFFSSFKDIDQNMLFEIGKQTDVTIYMLILSAFWGIIIGLPLGILLYTTRKGQILSSPLINFILSVITNIFRSIPFVILIAWIQPFTKFTMNIFTGEGVYLGDSAAIIPLSIGVSPFIARMIENALLDVPKGLIEASRSMGATPFQIIRKVLLPEALPLIINSITIALITLTGYIAMVGAIGSGGLGQLAINYGYNQSNIALTNIILIILIAIVLIIQFIGNFIVKRITHH